MDNIEYEQTLTLGWGVIGVIMCSIRRSAIKHGCELEHTPPFRTFTPLNTVTIKAKGGNIKGFRKEFEKLIERWARKEKL